MLRFDEPAPSEEAPFEAIASMRRDPSLRASALHDALSAASRSEHPCPTLDAHCHLGLMRNGGDVAAQAAHTGLTILSMGVEPAAFRRDHACLERLPNVQVGLGLHPWYVDGVSWRDQVDAFERMLPDAVIVGEVGLDFGASHADTRTAQHAAFERILQLVASGDGRFVSIHAVKAAGTALDLLEESGAHLRNTIAFHWFSGSSDDLQRAIRLGALFSVSARMLATKRGRAYVRAIPSDRLLVETDAPARPGDAYTAAALADELHATAQLLRSARS